MDIQPPKNLKETLAKGDTQVVIDQLLKVTDQKDLEPLHNQVVQLSNQYEGFLEEKRLGTASQEKLEVANAKVQKGLLELIDILQHPERLQRFQEKLARGSSESKIKKTGHLNPYRIAGYFGALVIIVFTFILWEPCPTAAQMQVFKIVLSVGIAGLLAGGINFLYPKFSPIMGVGIPFIAFLLLFFFNPITLINTANCQEPFDAFIHFRTSGEDSNWLSGKKAKLKVGDFELDAKAIDENGTIVFRKISSAFQNDSISLTLDTEVPHVITDQSAFTFAKSKEIYFTVEPKSIQIMGQVFDQNTKTGTPEVELVFDGKYRTTTDHQGFYQIFLPKTPGSKSQVLILVNEKRIENRTVTLSEKIPLDWPISI